LAVDIKFYDLDDQEISIDKVIGGLDFGIVRKNQQYILPVKIRNMGDSDALNVAISGSSLDSPIDVSEAEYANQLLSAHWKYFSLLPTKNFASTLDLPDILAGEWLLGKKEYTDLFTNPASSAWINDTFQGHIFSWSGNSLICTGSSLTTAYYARAIAEGWGNNKEVDMVLEFNQPVTPIAGSAFIFINLRQNCLGDEKGYLLTIKRNSTTGTMFAEIRKGAGVKSNAGTDFGAVFSQTNAVSWVDFAPLRYRLFTNDSGLPEIKVWYNNILDTDTPLIWTGNTTSWVDTANTYRSAGKIMLVFGAGANIAGQFEVRKATLLTDDPEGKVYIKTMVGDGAVDSTIYKSALELYYDPV